MEHKYKLEVESACGERFTRVSGNTVQECIDKLHDYHELCDSQRKFFLKKGEQRLKEKLESGWYTNI